MKRKTGFLSPAAFFAAAFLALSGLCLGGCEQLLGKPREPDGGPGGVRLCPDHGGRESRIHPL
jgi:hypothetical protein